MAGRIGHNAVDRLVTRAVYAQSVPVLGHVVRTALSLCGVNVPRAVRPGPGFLLVHATAGVVLHSGTRIGRDVTVLQNVTVGRIDPWEPGDTEVVLEDDVILCAGAVVLGPHDGTLTVGAGTIVGANAVLVTSTGPGEVWAGAPARRVGTRRGWAARGREVGGEVGQVGLEPTTDGL